MNLKMANPIAPWKKILRTNFTDVDKLATFLEMDEVIKLELLNKPKFSLNLPLRLASKIKKNDLNDPIFKQFVPLNEELKITNGFLKDPVGDINCKSSAKLLHKYEGRVLLVTTSACAMHCRYCFRQNFDYETMTGFLFTEELKLIAEDDTIQEVLLSGGDPLSLSNEVLKNLIFNLSNIPHVKRLRFHSRFPIGIPERIDEEFIEIIQNSNCQIYFVLHVNHPNELDEAIYSAVKKLQKAHAIVLNQSVLLFGVNDDVDTLVNLSNCLIDNGILPYYLHQLDRVQGAAHFEVSEEKGLHLIAMMSKKLPGYAVPKYVREIEGQASKTPIQPPI